MDPDRLLAPYLKEAGLKPKDENYGNWENTGLDGHIGGHYLSALSLAWAATGSSQIKDRLDYMLSELARAQKATGGYLGQTPVFRTLRGEIDPGEPENAIDTFFQYFHSPKGSVRHLQNSAKCARNHTCAHSPTTPTLTTQHLSG